MLLVLQMSWTPEARRVHRLSTVLPAIETVASYPSFARKIRHPCGMSRHPLVASPKGAETRPLAGTRSKAETHPLAELRPLAGTPRGANPVTGIVEKSWAAETQDILLNLVEIFYSSLRPKEMAANITQSLPAKEMGLRRKQRRLEDEKMDKTGLQMAQVRGLLAAVARLEAEVEETVAMAVSYSWWWW